MIFHYRCETCEEEGHEQCPLKDLDCECCIETARYLPQ